MHSPAPQTSSSYPSSSATASGTTAAVPARYARAAAQPNASAFHVFQAAQPSHDGTSNYIANVNTTAASATTTTFPAREASAAAEAPTRRDVVVNGTIGKSAGAGAGTAASGSENLAEGQQEQQPHVQTQIQTQTQRPTTTMSPEVAAEEALRRGKHKGRRAEEVDAMTQTASRIAARLAEDHQAVLYPDVDTPFANAADVVKRLLPYHVFQHPLDDLMRFAHPERKGKRKATEEDLLREEIAETKLALQCWKRKIALERRFREIRTRSSKRTAPDDQAYVLAQLVLEADRAENAAANAEYRTARSELDAVERKRKLQIAQHVMRVSGQSPTPTSSSPSTPARTPQPSGSVSTEQYPSGYHTTGSTSAATTSSAQPYSSTANYQTTGSSYSAAPSATTQYSQYRQYSYSYPQTYGTTYTYSPYTSTYGVPAYSQPSSQPATNASLPQPQAQIQTRHEAETTQVSAIAAASPVTQQPPSLHASGATYVQAQALDQEQARAPDPTQALSSARPPARTALPSAAGITASAAAAAPTSAATAPTTASASVPLMQINPSTAASTSSTVPAPVSAPASVSAPSSSSAPVPAPTTASAPSFTPTSIPASSYVSTGPIPVLLPSSALSALSGLGIVPVPAANAPPPGQPQPAAVIRGTTQNGTMVSLEINVGALQGAQAGALAMVLSALTGRGAVGAGNADTHGGTSAGAGVGYGAPGKGPNSGTSASGGDGEGPGSAGA